MVMQRIASVLDPDSVSVASRTYNRAMVVVIVVSLVPLAFKGTNAPLLAVDRACTAVFIADYVVRWACAGQTHGRGALSYVIHPLTPMAILDLLSILPGVAPVNSSFRLLRLVRFARALRFIRFIGHSESFRTFQAVIRREGRLLASVALLAGCYVLVCALVIFNVEPQTFDSFFDAVYWSCVSLTTVGYGDIYPVSVLGRIVTMVSSLIGIAVVALPAGIITSGYLDELRERRSHR